MTQTANTPAVPSERESLSGQLLSLFSLFFLLLSQSSSSTGERATKLYLPTTEHDQESACTRCYLQPKSICLYFLAKETLDGPFHNPRVLILVMYRLLVRETPSQNSIQTCETFQSWTRIGLIPVLLNANCRLCESREKQDQDINRSSRAKVRE
jgi:hypothetical protein